MSREILALYALCVVIWGSTWIGLKYQVGPTPTEFSVALRFAVAAVILAGVGLSKRYAFTLPKAYWRFCFFHGTFVFFLGYIFSYNSVKFLTSGLVAVVYSLMPLFNLVFSRIFFKTPLESRVVVAIALGFLGIGCVFHKDWLDFVSGAKNLWGLFFSLGGVSLGALGNMAAVRLSQSRVPMVIWNFYGMAVGALLTSVYLGFTSKQIVLDQRGSYWLAFLFLTVFGSVIAFLAYYRVQKILGAARASYMTVIFPIIALTYSFFLEKYSPDLFVVIGVALILSGNLYLFARIKSKPGKIKKP